VIVKGQLFRATVLFYCSCYHSVTLTNKARIIIVPLHTLFCAFTHVILCLYTRYFVPLHTLVDNLLFIFNVLPCG